MNTIHKIIRTGPRLFLGLVFIVFGLNFFLHFMPTPPAPPRGAAFAGALFASGYLFPLVAATQVVAGLLLVSNRFVALALAVLAPIVINIVGFHLFLAPSGLGLALALLASELALAWNHRAAFAPMLRPRVTLAREAVFAANQPARKAA